MTRPTILRTMPNLVFISLSLLCLTAHAQRSDPFAPLPPVNAQAHKNYDLKMLVVTENKRTALINDTVVTEGDKIGEALVLHIAKDHVILSKAGSKIVVKIGQS